MMTWLIRITGFFLLLTTFLPLLSTGKWYVRWWDFPRLQLAVLLFAALSITAFWCARTTEQKAVYSEPVVWTLLLTAAFFWLCSHIIRFSPVWPKEVPNSIAGRAGSEISIMVANLDYENHESATSVVQDLLEADADVLLVIELSQSWLEKLTETRNQYAHRYEYVRDEGLGMAIWSKFKLKDSETKFLVSERRASLWTKLITDAGDSINFVGVHPTPPGLLDSTGNERRDSRVRDAELVLVAKQVAERDESAWIVAGDFNDVAWSHTTRLFKRTSGLLDPRIGRSFMGTFIAQCPPCRCPIDHVFLSKDFAIKKLARKRITGSDHFAVIAVVTTEAPKQGTDPRPEGDDPEDAAKIVEEGISDAEARGVEGSN